MRTRVYLAGPWAKKAIMHQGRAYLQRKGLDVVSNWTDQPDDSEVDPTPEFLRRCAENDWRELGSADVLIIMNLAGWPKSEGKASEVGAAIAMGTPVILVAPNLRGNIFYNLPQVRRVDTLLDAAKLALQFSRWGSVDGVVTPGR